VTTPPLSGGGQASDLLSIVVLSYESENRLAKAASAFISLMDEERIPFEMVIVDDGSQDDSVAVAQKLARDDGRLRVVELSKNFGSPYSTFAGYSIARGDCVIAVPDDLQSPPELVVRLYRRWQEGHRLVIATRRSRDDGLFSDLFSNGYYWLMNRFSSVTFPPGGSDRFLADREVVDILNTRIRPINTSPILEVLRLGFSPCFVAYDRPTAPGKSRWTIRKKVRLMADTFFGSSSVPLRLITVMGFGVFAGSLALAIAIAWARLFTDWTVFGLANNGWATSMVVMAMLNGLILFSMGVVAEYVWRIHEEVKGRPGFLIRADPESGREQDRRNRQEQADDADDD